MKKRIERYILNEPWEERLERWTDIAQRRVILPFLAMAALYIFGLAFGVLLRG